MRRAWNTCAVGSVVGSPITSTIILFVVSELTNGATASEGSNKVVWSQQNVSPATVKLVQDPSVGTVVTGEARPETFPRALTTFGKRAFVEDGSNSTRPSCFTVTVPRSTSAPPPCGKVSVKVPVTPSGVVNLIVTGPSGTPISSNRPPPIGRALTVV